MIPETLLGLVLLAATLGPGYLYVRYAGDRSPRRVQSPLQEMIEMLVIGGVAAVASAAAVLIVGDRLEDGLDTGAISDDPGRYLLTEPGRSFAALGVFFALSYLGVGAVAVLRFRGKVRVSHGSSWHRMFYEMLPDPNKHTSLLTVELRDGRKITGAVASFTREQEEGRELVLVPPIRVQPSPDRPMGPRLNDHFLILKDEDIAYIAGRWSWWEKDDPKPRLADP